MTASSRGNGNVAQLVKTGFEESETSVGSTGIDFNNNFRSSAHPSKHTVFTALTELEANLINISHSSKEGQHLTQ